MFEDTSGLIYVGDRDKGYEKLEDLVQSGLITLYLDQKAGPYIDLMCDLTQFNNHHNQHPSTIHNGTSRQHSSHRNQDQQFRIHPFSPNSHSTLISSTASPLNAKLNSFKLSSNSSTISKNQQHSPSPSVSSLSRSSVVSKIIFV